MLRNKNNKWNVLLGILFCSSGAYANVEQTSSNAFTVRFESVVNASAAETFTGLTEVPNWWSADHTYSGSAKNLTLVPRAGGCFCETWEDGSVEHLRVVYAEPGKELRFRGGLGPLQSMPVNGLMQWRMTQSSGKAQEKGKTRLIWEYRVWGGEGTDLSGIADPVNQVLAQQFDALLKHLETVKPLENGAGIE